MRKHKNVSKCPSKLQEIIELVNLLPPNAEQVLKIVNERSYNNECWIQKGDIAVFDFLSEKAEMYYFDTIFKSLVRKKIAEYCLQPERNIIESYNDLLKAKSLFRHFAKINRQYPNWNEIKDNKFEQYKFQLHFLTIDYKERQFAVFVGVMPDGFIKTSRSELLEIFESEEVPFYRIRACEICEKIFWAKRTDAKTCKNKKCSNALSQRKYQNRNKDEINEKRRENYQYKKKSKKCETIEER